MSENLQLLEFPCDFPIKAVGNAREDFVRIILELVREHAPEVTEQDVKVRESRNGRFMSVTVTVRAQSAEHVKTISAALSECEHIIMSL